MRDKMNYYYGSYNNKYFGRKHMSFDNGAEEHKLLQDHSALFHQVTHEKWSVLSNIVLEENTHAFQSIIDHVRTNNGIRMPAPEPRKKKK